MYSSKSKSTLFLNYLIKYNSWEKLLNYSNESICNSLLYTTSGQYHFIHRVGYARSWESESKKWVRIQKRYNQKGILRLSTLVLNAIIEIAQ